MRKKQGITMITLVIIVIVLLILAGITLGSITSQNGLINNVENVLGNLSNKAVEHQGLLDNIAGVSNTNEENGEEMEEKLLNGGFESPVKAKDSGSPNYATVSDIEGWNTTSTDGKIEFGWVQNHATLEGVKVCPHMPAAVSTTVEGTAIPEGQQYGELNAEEAGTLYQTFTVESPMNLDFKMYHRGRSGVDALAIIIGQSQAYEPSKADNSKTNKDQYQQMIDWLKENKTVELTSENAKGWFIYSSPFANNGGFESENPFSFTADENHTQKWSVWIICSNNTGWNEFASYYSAENAGNYIFAMTSYYANETGNSATKVGTWGNLIDGISLKEGNRELLKNGGFEAVIATNGKYLTTTSANNSTPNTAIGWSASTVEKKVEIGASVSTYISTAGSMSKIVYKNMPYVREGKQFAELNGEQASSLYQNIAVIGGKKYYWGASHRGRNGIDTMALIIGPKQTVNPSKENKTSTDQLVKIAKWIKEHPEIHTENSGVGCSKKISIYTTKFSETLKGEFITEGVESPFSRFKDEEHTEKWNIWLISSNNDKWYDYGSVDPSSTYDYSYIVPETQTDCILAFVSYEPAPKSNGEIDYSYGNLLDCLTLSRQDKVEYEHVSGEKNNCIFITMENE